MNVNGNLIKLQYYFLPAATRMGKVGYMKDNLNLTIILRFAKKSLTLQEG